MELINQYGHRRFGQEITNVYYRTKLNLSQLKRKADSINTSMRHKSQRDIQQNNSNAWYQVSVKKRTTSQHDSATHRQKSSRCSSRTQTQQTVRFCDVRQILIDEKNRLLVEEIDITYSNKPQYCSQYAYDIQEYLKSIEINHQIRVCHYFHHQPQVTQKMRTILVEWLIDVSNKFRLKQETTHTTIDLLDRYLLTTPVSKNILQLVGVSCLFIAGKLEEVHQLMAKDLSYITDRTYSKEQILYTESLILKQLDFKLNNPLAITFLNRYQNVAPLTLKHFYYCQLLIDVYLLLQPQTHKSSELAAAIFYLVRKQQKYNPIWPEELIIVSSCNEGQLNKLVKVIQQCQLELQARQPIFNSLYQKYSQYKYCRILNQ